MKDKLKALEVLGIDLSGIKETQSITIQIEVENGEITAIIPFKKKGQSKTIEERKSAFKTLLLESIKNTSYSSQMNQVKEFFEYWTEHGVNDKKMRFEKQEAFDIKRRLGTWFRNAKQFNGDQQKSILNKRLSD